jgi:predicted nuclease of predicted toxin-antitoxin system
MNFLIDESLKIKKNIIANLKNTINVESVLKRGEADYSIISYAIRKKMVLVTKDNLMTIKALINGVSVLYVNEKLKIIQLVNPQLINESEYLDLYNYFKEKFGEEK